METNLDLTTESATEEWLDAALPADVEVVLSLLAALPSWADLDTVRTVLGRW